MNKPNNQPNSSLLVVQVIKNFIGKLRQNPDIYPIRYYKKTRRFQRNFSEQVVK